MILPPAVLPAIQTLVQAVLAALGPSQNQRLLRLHTPLGPNVLLAERMSGVETIGPRVPGSPATAGFKFEVLALSTNAHLQLKDLIGQPVRLDLLTQQSATELRPYHGHVTAFALLGSNGGLARYKLTIEPWLSVLAHTQDSYVFQDATVMDIVDEVFARYQGQGQLAPRWRWELADPSVYARRSLCVQIDESHMDLIARLLVEEGLFYWFEHQAADSDTLGEHTLVIADHNGCFQPNAQPRVRYTQSASASFKEDSLTEFNEHRHVTTTALAVASFDHRSVQQMSAQPLGDARLSTADVSLILRDQPGAYAYEDAAQAERIAQRQLEAIQAPAWQYRAQGSFRQAACGTTIRISEHPSADAGTSWVTLGVQSRARNNLNADLGTGLQRLLGQVPQPFVTEAKASGAKPSLFKGSANQTEEPLYQAQLLLQDASIPVRAASALNERGDLVFKRPHLIGVQTAIVVGVPGGPIHTDRDGRVKVQLHWQRGAQSSHRLDHPAGSNAPGDDSAGTWVRVGQAWAGNNWGGHHTPRLGQEVVVAMFEGDADRAVVIGCVYGGQGQPDAQGNQIASGAAGATGNAGPWFPGSQRAGEQEGHQHTQVLAGFKSQSMETSQSGSGGYNQLVLDDSPAQGRVTLGSTQAQTWLQIGHLIQQNDNQRLAQRGHGLDLSTTAHGAVRAGSGLHLSTRTRAQGTAANAQPSDARAPVAQLEQSTETARALIDTGQKHNFKFKAEPEPKKLPDQLNKQALIDSQSQTDTQGGAAQGNATEGDFVAQGGGQGSVAAPGRPDLVVYGDGGIISGTPAHTVMSAGTTAGLTAAQDINLGAGRNIAIAVKYDLGFFTVGKASDPNKPNQETGLQFHAGSGGVSVRAQASTLGLTADKGVHVASTTSSVTVSSPKRVLLNGGGSSILITTGNITLTTNGVAKFMAAMKELTGPASAQASLTLPKAKPLEGCAQKLGAAEARRSALVER